MTTSTTTSSHESAAYSSEAAWRHLVLGNAFEAARRPEVQLEAEEQQVVGVVVMAEVEVEKGWW
jgi:hypothetical protein